jgi:hypothetical protein
MRRPYGRRGLVVVTALLLVVAGCSGMGLVGEGGDPTGPGTATDSPRSNATAGGDAVASSLRFREIGSSHGFNYTGQAPATMIVNGGVYVVDFDGDRWPDLLAVGGPAPVLFENENGTFERSGVLPSIDATVEGAHVFDYDGDGQEDLLLLAQDRSPILLENEGGEFTERPGAFPVNMTYPVGATSADYDGDGCLDVFVYQYADWAETQPAGIHNETVSGAEDNAHPNHLFRGDCTGEFTPVSGGEISGNRWTLAASFVDFTGDGRPDVHVANDFNYDVLYVNRGNGSFEQVLLGPETNRNAMSSEVGDVNGDGRPDVFVTNIVLPQILKRTAGPFAGRMEGNNLLINRGNGSFEDAAEAYGVRDGGWGWAAVLADFDNDGDEDLFHTTKTIAITPTVHSEIVDEGMSREEYVLRHPSIRYPRFFERDGDGFDSTRAASLGFEEGSGTGVARLDFDRDGDLDLAVAQVEGGFRLYENELAGEGTHWVRIEVRGEEGLPATGARVVVTVDGQDHHRLVNSRADHLSQDSRLVHVGLGDTDTVDRVRIVWPDGTEVVLGDLAADQRVTVNPDGRTDTATR